MTQALGGVPTGFAATIVAIAGVVLIAVLALGLALSRGAAWRVLGGPQVSVSRASVRAGQPITVRVQFQPRAPVAISGIHAEVDCTEEVEIGVDGEVQRTEVYRRQEWLLSASRLVKAGTSVDHQVVLVVPVNATPSGQSGITRVIWSLGVVIELDGRTGWRRKLPLTVLP